MDHGPESKTIQNKAIADLFKKGSVKIPSSDGIKWDVETECWLKNGKPIQAAKGSETVVNPRKTDEEGSSESKSEASSSSGIESSQKGFMLTGKKAHKKLEEEKRKAEKDKKGKKEFPN